MQKRTIVQNGERQEVGRTSTLRGILVQLKTACEHLTRDVQSTSSVSSETIPSTTKTSRELEVLLHQCHSLAVNGA